MDEIIVDDGPSPRRGSRRNVGSAPRHAVAVDHHP
jgi:hypothetical protein